MPDGELIEYVCENERDKPHLVGKTRGGVSCSGRGPGSIRRVLTIPQSPTGVVVSLEGDRLMIDPGGSGKIPLIAQSENSFSMEGNVVEFVKDAKGEVTGVVQHWTEGDRFATRKH